MAMGPRITTHKKQYRTKIVTVCGSSHFLFSCFQLNSTMTKFYQSNDRCHRQFLFLKTLRFNKTRVFIIILLFWCNIMIAQFTVFFFFNCITTNNFNFVTITLHNRQNIGFFFSSVSVSLRDVNQKRIAKILFLFQKSCKRLFFICNGLSPFQVCLA